MKPYAFRGDGSDDTGCCPGHDWPRCFRWVGKYTSTHSKRTSSKSNKICKRTRRRIDKENLKQGEEDVSC